MQQQLADLRDELRQKQAAHEQEIRDAKAAADSAAAAAASAARAASANEIQAALHAATMASNAAAEATLASQAATGVVRDMLLEKHHRKHNQVWHDKKRARAAKHHAAGKPLSAAAAESCSSCGNGQPGQNCANHMCGGCCIWWKDTAGHSFCSQHHSFQ